MKRVLGYVALLLVVANTVLVFRVVSGRISLADMRPQVEYLFQLQMSMDLSGQRASVRSYLPSSDDVQTIQVERVEHGAFSYEPIARDGNRVGVWTADGVSGHEIASYQAQVRIRQTDYRIPPGIGLPHSYPAEIARYLEASDQIQSDAPAIRSLADSLTAPAGDVLSRTRAIYDFVLNEIQNSEYENTLDAVTTLKWGEAFCGGKSRLLAALFRAGNIPARMVGGVIMRSGSKRVSHAWVEAWINGVWVPFDPLNDHFAERPGNYLVLYRGDHALITRTSNSNFRYVFNTKKWRTSPEEALTPESASIFNTYLLWNLFREAHISLNLLRILLVLPIGVVVIVLFRNVVGIATFGTFMPALIAAAFRDTGLVWGTTLFFVVLIVGLTVRAFLERMQLLQTPRLAIVLTFVMFFMLVIAYAGVRGGVLEAARVSMFPIAILTVTVENAFVRMQDRGVVDTARILFGTLLVVWAAYLVMDNYFIQAIVFAFPELLLAILAVYLVVGRWVGLRFFELYRFRRLLAAGRSS